METFSFKKQPRSLWEKSLIAFSLNIPKSQDNNREKLELVGWVIGKNCPALKLQIRQEKQVLQEIPINKPRPKVAELYPNVSYAKNSGFKCELNIRELSTDCKLEVIVFLGTNTKATMGVIESLNSNQDKKHEFQEQEESKTLETLSKQIFRLQKDIKKLNEELVKESQKRKELEFIVDSYNQLNSQKDFGISASRQIANRLIAYSNNFARNHHLACPDKKFIYCFIPKNACTTFKNITHLYSDDNKVKVQGHLIHAQERKLIAETQDLLDNTYFKFVVLRNPFFRLVSAYFDKFVSPKPESLAYMAKDVVEKVQGKDSIIGISFQEFVEYLYETRSNILDQHWRCQLDFLIFDEYDMYLKFEKLDTDIPKLEQALDIKIPKENVAIHTTQYSKVNIDKPWAIKSTDLRNLLEVNSASRFIFPQPHQMFTDDLIAKIKYRYKGDIELYESLYGKNNIDPIR